MQMPVARLLRLAACGVFALGLGACSMAGMPQFKAGPAVVAKAAPKPRAAAEPFEPLAFTASPTSRAGRLQPLISKYASVYGVPESLIHRLIQRESGYNPAARNGPYYGLMQIHPATAKSMGYSGPASGLLDADTNLRYAVKYLRGAYLVAGRNADGAVRNYSRGYYYDAKRMGLLEEVGLR